MRTLILLSALACLSACQRATQAEIITYREKSGLVALPNATEWTAFSSGTVEIRREQSTKFHSEEPREIREARFNISPEQFAELRIILLPVSDAAKGGGTYPCIPPDGPGIDIRYFDGMAGWQWNSFASCKQAGPWNSFAAAMAANVLVKRWARERGHRIEMD